MEYPSVCIMLLTYAPKLNSPRAKYAEQTLRSALDQISYSGKLSVHIADDGSPAKHVENLKTLAGGYAHVQGISSSNSARGGYGANYNLATQMVHSFAEIVLPLEDDWVAPVEIDLDPFVTALVDRNTPIQCVRLGYLGFTQPLRGELGAAHGRTYLLFDPLSPEPHVCAGHPRLETVEFERKVGPWPEGVDPGTTEILWCQRPEARKQVAWDMDHPLGGWFHHIGTEQARSDQEKVAEPEKEPVVI